ncbi:RNA-binding transcriptional accessory protein [Solemya pervernicosa gill symbiont]|uniref:RNA-binding transcriptional accessory protein n=2 Tax=Gammaproteobacteria incertae sedis TaxID=118884 RepID=A0A1T2L4D3_9GAMM|nr:Tex family protein [Candidatus Reidiella endopervernicosa]OOZ39975.1 RNA-binding transcriptional accessory protein [Solemya pervernicosa gill symbiont]QKQ27775.1 RNA-binding transcriptional accessory protein [Candidatus Reidiella endopervernicosa]
MNIAQNIAEELAVKQSQVDAAIALLDEGSTVPFIARYRKEATGGLDDIQLRRLEERLVYLRELEDRRAVVLKSIDEQEKLTPELKEAILAAETKTRLEDLYLPYKPKRRTKAQIAREAGLEPLADALMADASLDPQVVAAEYVDEEKGIADVAAALDGARQIVMERIAENADLIGELRDYVWAQGKLESRVADGQEEAGAKFADYFEYEEQLQKIPSHRALALFRGRNESVLRLQLKIEGQDDLEPGRSFGICDGMIARKYDITDEGRAGDGWLTETVRWAWRVKVSLHIELELMMQLKEQAEEEAIRVFGENLRDLLLAAPAGPRATIGLDPGLRTGVKVVVVDATGKLVDSATIYPHVPKNQWDQSIDILAKLAAKHKAELVSIGNGTASRETDKLAADLMKRHPELRLSKIMVSEAGASVYSASEFASREFPDLDVSLRGAVSIARRLQDPLAELVKVEPKAIGVGQYQHDVSQSRLARMLDSVVEDCVNAVGVDVNTASAPLLAQVAGLGQSLAANIVSYRDEHGAFTDRKALLKVSRLGAKAFEQSAGFLKVMNGENPLDASAVHPEAYPLVERIITSTGKGVGELIGDSRFLRSLAANDFTDEKFGEPTVRDIISELEKPGRDPRPEFKTAAFRDGVEKLSDLEPGMILEGVVTNVTNFGAFVDIGVHQDGLVHISVLSDKFVKDPREVVKAGDVVKVKVVEVDLKRKRIALSRRFDSDVKKGKGKPESRGGEQRQSRPNQPRGNRPHKQPKSRESAPMGAMAAAFANLKK